MAPSVALRMVGYNKNIRAAPKGKSLAHCSKIDSTISCKIDISYCLYNWL